MLPALFNLAPEGPKDGTSTSITSSYNPTFEANPRLRATLTAILLVLLTPVSVLLTALAWVSGFGRPPKTPPNGKTVLVTGGKMTKSLHMARWFWRSGYRVVMIETPKYWHVGARFSRSVAAFHVVPDPRLDPEGYVAGLVRVARLENAEYFVPVSSPAAAISDAAAKEPLAAVGCSALHFDKPTCELLDNKHRFCEWARDELGLNAPDTVLLHSNDDARKLNASLTAAAAAATDKTKLCRYILKNLEYDTQHRLDLFQLPCAPEALDAYLATLTGPFALRADTPWQAQRFLVGQEYTAFAVLREGTVRALTVSTSSASQLNYVHVDMPEIEKWVVDFAAKTHLTGMLCWDFIDDVVAKAPFPIECNPRVHSQSAVFLDDDAFGAAILAPTPPPAGTGDKGPRRPPRSAVPVFWLYNEVFKVLFPAHYGRAEGGLRGLFRTVTTQHDAQLDGADPLPFIVANHVQMPMLLAGNAWRGNPWKKCDFCIGKVVEVNGD
jgi:hypothetical protein